MEPRQPVEPLDRLESEGSRTEAIDAASEGSDPLLLGARICRTEDRMKNDQVSGWALFIRLTIIGALATLLSCVSLHADPVVHKFQLWGTMNPLEKLIFYQGWTNGFLVARGESGVELASCLDEITGEQAIAMIDKRYKDHPERWSHPITQQMLEALTAEGGPCEGKNPLPADSN